MEPNMTSNRSSVTVKRESKYLKRGGKNHTNFLTNKSFWFFPSQLFISSPGVFDTVLRTLLCSVVQPRKKVSGHWLGNLD